MFLQKRKKVGRGSQPIRQAVKSYENSKFTKQNDEKFVKKLKM